MTITPALVQQFEDDQKAWDTSTAIHNLLWLKADQDLRDLGARRVTTVMTPQARQAPTRGGGRHPLNANPKMRGGPRR